MTRSVSLGIKGSETSLLCQLTRVKGFDYTDGVLIKFLHQPQAIGIGEFVSMRTKRYVFPLHEASRIGRG